MRDRPKKSVRMEAIRRRLAVTQAEPRPGFANPQWERVELLGSNDIKARRRRTSFS